MRKRLFVRFLVALSALALAGCGSATTTSQSASTLGLPASAIPSSHPDLKGMTVTIADQGSPSVDRFTEFHIVKLLRSWGANASILWTPSQQIAASAIIKGTAQVYTSTIADALPSVDNGLNIVAFGINNPKVDYVLLAAPGVTSIQDLKGKSIGVLTGGPDDITYDLVEQALQSAGLTIHDINLVTVGGQTLRVDALVAGRISATVVSHTYLLKLRSSGYHSLFDFTQRDPNLYNDIFWARPDWLAAHPKLAVAFNMAALETYRTFDNPKTEPQLVAEADSQVPGAVASQTQALFKIFSTYDMYPPNAVLQSSALQQQEQLYYRYHTLDTLTPLSKWATTKYDAAALQVLGTAKS